MYFKKEDTDIFSKFLNVKPEKKERVLNAALREFAQQGYEKASTNAIVKEADISKGLLFHYFNSKKDLFLFLYDHFLQIISEEFFKRIDLIERDVLIKLRNVALIKMELMDKYPELFNFFITVMMEDSREVKGELDRRNRELLSYSYGKLFENIDADRFKEGIDIGKAIDMITWTVEGFANRELEKAKRTTAKGLDYDRMFKEMDSYLEMFRRFFYK